GDDDDDDNNSSNNNNKKPSLRGPLGRLRHGLRGPAAAAVRLPTGSVRTFQYSKNGARLAWATSDAYASTSHSTWFERPSATRATATNSARLLLSLVNISRPRLQRANLRRQDCPTGCDDHTEKRNRNKFLAERHLPRDLGTAKPAKLEDGAVHHNLVLWSAETGEKLVSWPQKNAVGWNLQWSDDEYYCARMVTNEIHFYDVAGIVTAAKTGATPHYRKFKLEGLGQFSISPGKSPSLAVFMPEKKGAPASVRLYSITNFNAALTQKTFYKADRVQFIWNDFGTNLLFLTQTETDKTGKSYYGETNLYYLAVAGNFDCRVHLDKEGAIHDVAWRPNSKEFVVVYGFMPAKATLFDQRANVIHEFGAKPWNFVRFNPQGRIICIAGFGNLAGQMDFWDRNTLQIISSCTTSNASQCEWSPDGRYVMTSTMSPRLRVDNGYTLWHYRGVVVAKGDVDELYQVAWQPRCLDVPLPEMTGKLEPTPKGIEGVTAKPASAKPVGKYRPPGARGAAAPAIYQREDSVAVTSSKAAATASVSQGEQEPSKATLRNKKKRESAKKKKQEEAAAAADSKEGLPAGEPRPSSATNKAADAGHAAVPAGSGMPEMDKKIRNVEKKLRQIAELKERRDRGDALEQTQLQKIATEDSVAKELAALKMAP
ncbi:MAG: eukaryotic translation initiation factor eIF2A-domain-containing protein, partial [Olpidium bornovanus]